MSNEHGEKQTQPVAVCSHPTRLAAEVTRSALESCGVQAAVVCKSKTKNPLLGMAGPLLDAYEVQVAADDAERAREILDGDPEARGDTPDPEQEQ